ncbi:hypothetical protein CcI49_03315 [Frankia sp. CcI49]|uniref:hypothetical protein n=1 Tax=unclassified Frankia TaxID=2632575 RepID=UPI0006CA0C5D|nr:MULTISPECIES: hypothetical protein [unclassified Frankia]KPM55743.1 hypothetical protein ACG83_10725 [Frankia sp. R43]ONH62422.1 hypothetical protein CcI49_03315 [Frankia sp. CcI49]
MATRQASAETPRGESAEQVIARRGRDEPERAGQAREFRRQFVVDARSYGEGFDHGPNQAGTTHEAVFAGLRPAGEARLVSEEPHRDGRHTVLTYAVPVELADPREAAQAEVEQS